MTSDPVGRLSSSVSAPLVTHAAAAFTSRIWGTQIRARLPAPGRRDRRARQAGARGLQTDGSARHPFPAALTRSGERTCARQCLAKSRFAAPTSARFERECCGGRPASAAGRDSDTGALFLHRPVRCAVVQMSRIWAWIAFAVGMIYFFVPLIGTLEFSLRMRRGVYSLDAYRVVLADPRFQATFTDSVVLALLTIVLGVLIVVPTAYWVRLRLPRWRTQ